MGEIDRRASIASSVSECLRAPNSSRMKAIAKTLLSNSIWSLLNQFARVASLALTTILLSRYFGPQKFGQLAVGLAVVRIFRVVSAFGLDRVLVREIAEKEESGHLLVGDAFRLNLKIACVSFAIMLALVFCACPTSPLLFWIVLLAGVGLLFQPCDVFDYYFQARNRFCLTTISRAIPSLVSVTGKVGAVLLGAPLLVFAGLETIEMALIALGLSLVYLTRRRDVKTYRTVTPFDAGQLLKEAFPLLLGSLAAMIYMRADVLILGSMKGYGAAGIYSAAAQITEACALFPMALSPALLPVLVKWQRSGLSFYRQQFEKLFLAAGVIGLLVSLVLTFTAPILIQLLYGLSFGPAAKILVVHAWAAIFMFLGIIQTGYEVTVRLTWWTAARTAAGALSNVALNFMLIPRFGAIGAAVATLIAFAGSGFFFNALHPASRPIFIMQARALLLAPLGALLNPRRPQLTASQFENPGRVAR